ncbi:MAG: hypothetical protein K6G25_11155, partial [Bacteroidales bacterium]|nr:hypothetical protein [Bacteroidales bacterium]
ASNLTATTADLGWTGSILTDSYTVKYRTAQFVDAIFTEGFEGGTMPSGWTQSGPGTWNVTEGYGYNSIGTHSGTYNVKINHLNTDDETFLITPMLDLSGQNALTLNFWYINFIWSPDIDQLYVYYRVDQGEWIELWSTTEDHQEWTTSGIIPLPNPSANYQIGFKMIDKWGRGVGIDDITISSENLTDEWQTATSTTTSVTLTGLNPNTNYEAQVKSDCDEANWSELIVFTTQENSVFTKDIEGYGTGEGGWQLIASPVLDEVTPANTNGFLTNAYDLYRFNPLHEGEEWENYEDDHFSLVNGQGYLYANSGDVTLTFMGAPVAGNDSVEVPLTYDADDDQKCWNLVGNPFDGEAYLNREYYVLNADGTGINPVAVPANTPIQPCTAVFVKATAAGQTVVFTRVAP